MSQATQITVNGAKHSLAIDPDTPLLYALRNELKLKGTRFGCGQGLCGACSVLVDGRRMFSCDVPLWSVSGKSITTIEGIGTPDNLDRLQQAIIEEQAVQCGYCINGIIIAAKELLDANPHPSESDIRVALDRNLCRCGTHTRIIRAIQRAASYTNSEASHGSNKD